MSETGDSAYIKGSGHCIFCEQKGDLSKEHIFGQWLKKYFPRDQSTTHVEAKISWPAGVITDVPIDLRKIKLGHSGSRKLRIVCQTCNNGWLSGLEDWAKDVLPYLMDGRRANLSPSGQKKLAVWAIKTSMIAAYTKPRDTGISQAERTCLFERGHPPDGWFVWACSYQGGVWSPLTIFQDRGALSPTPVPDADSAPYYIQATTFGVGRILFCVLSSSSPDVSPHFTNFEPEGVFQIWPQTHPRSVIWPPIGQIGEEQAYGFANIIRSSEVFNHSRDRAANWNFSF